MKIFVFIIFAGCAVKCDESGNPSSRSPPSVRKHSLPPIVFIRYPSSRSPLSVRKHNLPPILFPHEGFLMNPKHVISDTLINYYVIERPSEEPSLRELKEFQVYWNVPTFQCRSKKIKFEQLFQKYGIIQNQNDTFQGEQITILYDPGLFPAILQEENSGKLRTRNGGVPQEGNLDDHLTAFRYVLDQSIPDPEFSGIGIIDFESWRPIFRQNFWGVLTPYKNLSLAIERQRHPWWTNSMIEREAKIRFERAGREFMQATVALARLLRPQAKWGYYGFPYCFNMAGTRPAETCANNIQKENDQISWLWAESTALYPSVYSSKNLSASQLAALIRGRVAESARVGRGSPILPYFWFKYRDAGFMTEVDLKTAIKTMYKSQTSGLILWGSSNDVNTLAKCEKLKNYLEQVLGPEIAKYTKQVHKREEAHDIIKLNNYNITTQNPFDVVTSDSNDDETIKTVDSNSDETNENNSENIQSQLDDEMMSTANDAENYKDERNILLDIVLSLIENVQKHDTKQEKETTMRKIMKDRKKGKPIHVTFTDENENDSDFTTRSPVYDFRKKGALFALFHTNKNTTTPTVNSASDEISTTEHNLESTTDSDKLTTYYNQDTFLDEELNYTTLNMENTETDYYNDETTMSIDHKFNDTTFTPSTTESMAEENGQYNTEIYYIYKDNTTQKKSYATDLNEISTESETTTLNTTDKMTTDTGEYDDSDIQVFMTLE